MVDASREDGVDDTVVLERRIDPQTLARLADRFLGRMVKYVVDIRREVVAAGGELHADAEQVLLAAGSRQADLWGANYYPGKGRDDCIEFTALINIRPSQGNGSMEIEDREVRDAVRRLTFAVLGEGEAL
jgi:hypothetical protein